MTTSNSPFSPSGRAWGVGDRSDETNDTTLGNECHLGIVPSAHRPGPREPLAALRWAAATVLQMLLARRQIGRSTVIQSINMVSVPLLPDGHDERHSC